MAPIGIGIDLFTTQSGIAMLNRAIQAAQDTPYGMLCTLAIGSPQNNRSVGYWNGVPDAVDPTGMPPPPPNDAITGAIDQVVRSVMGVMWNTGQTLFLFDTDGWGVALFDDKDAWAAPPWRILPSLGVIFAPYLTTSAHARLAQQDALTRVEPRLEAFSRTTKLILGTAPPPLVIDPTICTI